MTFALGIITGIALCFFFRAKPWTPGKLSAFEKLKQRQQDREGHGC